MRHLLWMSPSARSWVTTPIGRIALAWLLALIAATASAQSPAPLRVLNLSASATAEVAYDVLSVTLSASRQGEQAAAVQAQLRQALDEALAVARQAVAGDALTVRTGGFSLSPRHLRDGRMDGWQGHAELVIEGRDLPRVAELAGRIGTMTVAQVQYSLSRQAREQLEATLSAEAIARFRAKALEAAQGFGFGAYEVREVSLSSDEGMPPRPMPRLARAEMSVAAADMPLPVEAGKGTVSVHVSGSVTMK